MTDVARVAATPSAPGGWLFNLMVLAHITCAIGGFGALIYRSFVLDLARRRGNLVAAGVLAVYGQISQVGEVLLYGVGIFGIAAAAAAGGNQKYFTKPWLISALVIFVVMVGALHGLVRPAERRYRAAMLELAQMPGMVPPARPPQLAEMDRLYRRIGGGTGILNVLLLAALYLMVFRP